jgi:hypothetical protein
MGGAGGAAGSSGSAGHAGAGALGAGSGAAGTGGASPTAGTGGVGTAGTGGAEPTPYPGSLDAIVNWGTGKAYFFHAEEYIRYDLQEDTADAGYPKNADAYWPSLWPDDIDAAVSDGLGKAYFFRGDKYVRYDIATDQGDDGYPRAISDDWPAFMAGGIDAAVRVDDKWYFFHGGDVLRVSVGTRGPDDGAHEPDNGYPLPNSEVWSTHSLNPAPARVDAAFTSTSGNTYLFEGERYYRYSGSSPVLSGRHALDAGYPLVTRWYWPGLWDPNEGTGHPAHRLPAEVAALLADEPNAEELAARKARCAASVTSDETDLTVEYRQYVESVEARLGAYGCCLILKSSGAYRFRCATDTAGPHRLDIDPFTTDSIDWRNAAHHVDQVSQGDFSADAGTPLSVFASDDGTFSIYGLSANSATGSISGGLNIKVAYTLNGEERVIGFSHLNVNVPGYVIDAETSGEALPVGTVFGFIGYTGNLWIGAPPETDAPYAGSGAGLPGSHSHIWFKDDTGNHMALRPSTRESIDYSGTYPYGGG